MKVNLVVATGVHQGKAIPVAGAQFVIGRDPECQLRPASPAVSKKHCLFSVRDGSVFVKDLGSTNGTFVNDVQIVDETEVDTGDRVRIGPLDFSIQIAKSGSKPDNTPLPDSLKALPSGGRLSDGVGMKPAGKGATPMPMPKTITGPVAMPGTDEHKVPAPAPAAQTKPAAPKPKPSARSDDPDALAAAMLADGDDDPPVPEGSTVMELPTADLERLRMSGGQPGAAAAPPGKKAAIPSQADSSNAANDILKKYLQGKKKS